MGINLLIFAFFHNNIVQADNGIHRRANLMGHICKKFALRDAGLLCLAAHALNLVDISPGIGHIQNQDNTALLSAIFIYNRLAVAFIIPLVNGKALGNVLIEHFLAEIFDHADILSQPVRGKTGKNICRRPVIADEPVMVIQRNHAVAHAFQDFCRCQVAEIIIPAAPDYNDYHGYGNRQRNRRKVKYVHQLKHISKQHDNRKCGDSQNHPVLAADLMVRALPDCTHQNIYTQCIRNHYTAEQKKYIQRPIGNTDMIKSARIRHPLHIAVKKPIPVKEHRWQRKKADDTEHP